MLMKDAKQDELVWHDKDGCFSMALVYASIMKSKWCPSKKIWITIWKAKVFEKIKVFIWQSCHNWLLTNE